jgi:hypothetical protein
MVFCFRKSNISLHLIIGSQTAFCVTWLVSDYACYTHISRQLLDEVNFSMYDQVLQCHVFEVSALCSQANMVLLSAISDIV